MTERSAPESTVLEVRRDDLGETRIVAAEGADPGRDQVSFKVERFALTANNITYGVLGDMLGYWDFFPAPDADDGWGRIPAMGWGEVVASNVDGIDAGGRYYGWYPMAAYCSFEAEPTDDGLRDVSPHRSEHAPIYRSFVRTDLDPLHEAGEDAEDRHALLRGLFATGYLADEFFATSDYFDAEQAIVLSASSKTAIAYAERAAERGLDALVGITSPRNLEFVEGLGIYSRVLTYGSESELGRVPSVLVDMAGNGEVLNRVHELVGGQLGHSMIVGMSHHDAERGEVDAGPDPEMFFAPSEVKKQTSELGREEYQRRLGEALGEFVVGSERWLELERSSGPAEAEAAYRRVFEGKLPPSTGSIVSLG